MKHETTIPARAVFAALACVLAAGCASTDPAAVERQIRDFTAKKQFDKARAVPVQKGTLFMTDEEKTKQRLIKELVNPEEIKYITENIDKQVDKELGKKPANYDGARNVVWTREKPAVPEVDKGVADNVNEILRGKINVKQFVEITNAMDKAVTKYLAARDYDGARKYLFSIKPVPTYPGDVDRKLAEVGKELAKLAVPAATADEAVAAARPVLEAVFADKAFEKNEIEAGETFKPDSELFDEKLDEFRKTLLARGCSEADCDKAVSAIRDVADPALRELWVPVEDSEVPPPAAIGTTSLNLLVAALRDRQYSERVVPAEVADRIKALRSKVMPVFKAGQYEEARNEIFGFGTTGRPEVDDPVFAVKLGILNGKANVAILEKALKEIPAAVDARLAEKDIPGAIAVIESLRDVPAYDTAVDANLDDAAKEARKLKVPAAGAKAVVQDAKGRLYYVTAPRPEEHREARLMKAYLAEIAGAPAEDDGKDKLDWSAVRKCLDAAAALLVKDDMSEEEADALMDWVLESFKALLAAPGAPRKGKAITTKQLNEAFAILRAEQYAKIAAASKAEEKGKDVAIDMAENFALQIDFDTRINAFVAAVSDRVEPDVNRVLGDGARVLRLLRAGANVSARDATSLFVASIYMGFDDTASRALSLGADINGHSPKDSLARPALLLALQYGWKGSAADLLSSADRTVRDARGQGSVHYAVRGCNGSALVDLLRLGIDAKRADSAGVTPIVLAADLGYAGLVNALVPFSELEKADKAGFTALLRAAQNGRTDIVRALVAAGAELGAKTSDGDGALELAAKANCPDLLAYLLDEKKIAPTARVTSQLVIAGNVPTLQLMVEHGARLKDDHLAVAVNRSDFPMVKYLVNRGMDVNAESVKAAADNLVKRVADVDDKSAKAAVLGVNDGTYYGPDSGTIIAFLHEQGQRP